MQRRVITYDLKKRFITPSSIQRIHVMVSLLSSMNINKQTTLQRYEPRCEKTSFLHMRKQAADQLRSNCAAHQRLCFRHIDSTIPLPFKS